MKRVVYSTLDVEVDPGYMLDAGDNSVFLKSRKPSLTTGMIKEMIGAMCDRQGLDAADKRKSQSSGTNIARTRDQIVKAMLNHVCTDSTEYFQIEGDDFCYRMSFEDFMKRFTVCEPKFGCNCYSRCIQCAEELDEEAWPGFTFNFGRKEIFVKSDNQNLTNRIIRDFINIVCDIKGVGDAIRKKALYDEATLKDFRRRIMKGTLEHHVTANGTEYYSISGKDYSWSYPADEFEDSVIVMTARE